MMKNYYKILGLSENATKWEIKEAYRRLCRKFHPDKHKGDRDMERVFAEINEAYEFLIDNYCKSHQTYSEPSPSHQSKQSTKKSPHAFSVLSFLSRFSKTTWVRVIVVAIIIFIPQINDLTQQVKHSPWPYTPTQTSTTPIEPDATPTMTLDNFREILASKELSNASYHIFLPGLNTEKKFVMRDGVANLGGFTACFLNEAVTIDLIENRGVATVFCNYGASYTDVFLVAFNNLNDIPTQTDAVDLRMHYDLRYYDLFRVDVKQITLGSNGKLMVTVLTVPDALINSPGYEKNPIEPVTIRYYLDNQGALASPPFGL